MIATFFKTTKFLIPQFSQLILLRIEFEFAKRKKTAHVSYCSCESSPEKSEMANATKKFMSC